ncbi:MAG: hypothetical protein E7598_02795 [Ruminococcaceae bacterium]|nr:hypothetical protein [Oscillospiraceae bacterium]
MNKLKKFLTDSCILFTVFVFILYIAGHAIISTSITITLKTAAILFLCCLLLRVLHNVLYIKKIPVALRILAHYLLIICAAYIGFALIAKIVTNSLATFVLLSAITAIYCGVSAIIMAIGNKQKEGEKQKKEYKSIF